MRLFIAIPGYTGATVPEFDKSLRETIKILPLEIEFGGIDALVGCCYLPVARNKLCRKFIESDCDTMLFLDADISWNPKQLVEMLKVDEDIVAGLYRYKVDREEYPVLLSCDEDNGKRPIVENGLIMAYGVPTGCLKIKRSVFERLIAHYGEDLEIDEFNDKLEDEFCYWNFFDCEKIGRRWIGEDYNFCRKWTEIGGKIWVYPDITIGHHGKMVDILGNEGPYAHVGNFHDFMMRQPGGCKCGPVISKDYKGNNIYGWMSVVEMQWLYQQSSKYESVVEIGTFKGRSAHALLSGLSKTVTCIDPWNYETGKVMVGEEEYQEFLKNVEPVRGGNGRLNVIRNISTIASKEVGNVDMVFIDGDHSYESVIEDIKTWLPKTNRLICGHDYSMIYPGVIEAVDELFGDRVRQIDAIWYVEL